MVISEDLIVSVVHSVQGILVEGKPVHACDLADLLLRGCGCEDVNFYPSLHKGPCHEIAFFVSLTRFRLTTGPKDGVRHLDFLEAIEAMVQHMTGPCGNVTKQAVIITDSWQPAAIPEWLGTISTLVDKGKDIRFYLVTDLGIAQVKA